MEMLTKGMEVVTLSGGVVDLLSTAPQDVNVSISHVLFM